MSTLILGDIQGCYDELQDLLDRTGPDRIIALGDIVDRGPDSPRVAEFFSSQPSACSIMGNHERKHVRSFHGQVRAALSQRITRWQFGEERYASALCFMADLPRFIELPDAILIHGFYEPGVSLADQRETVIVGVMSGEQYLKERYDRPWFELYDGIKPIIVGHRDYSRCGEPFVYRERVWGLDTGCCFGGALTGLLLPEFRLVSVRSRGDHWSAVKAAYEARNRSSAPDNALTWSDLRALLAGSEAAMPSARVDRLRSMLTEAERALQILYEHLAGENARLLRDLRDECAFDDLTPSEQGDRYSVRVGRNPLGRWLHRVRKGELTLESLREQLTKPFFVIQLARRAGVL